MINDLLSIQGIKKNMNETEETNQLKINRQATQRISTKLKSPIINCDNVECNNQFTNLEEYIKHEIKCKSIKCDMETVYRQLEEKFNASYIRSTFKYVQCEWCDKVFEDKNGRGKHLLNQHQIRGKNAGKCVIGYIKSKLNSITIEEALELKSLIDEF